MSKDWKTNAPCLFREAVKLASYLQLVKGRSGVEGRELVDAGY
jgi:hypothetical protein